MQEKINLQREFVKVSGKEYTNHFVIGEFERNGKVEKMKIVLDVPRNDYGMYTVLDMVFDGKKEVPLYRKVLITKDMNTGRKTTRYRFECVSENGELVGVLVPKGESNLALLNLLFSRLNQDTIEEEEIK